MATIWLTYAWDDNKNQDVDYIAQEIERAGVTVKLDRWNIGAGRRLWEQIEQFIQDKAQSDAWLLYATQASLGSEACKEEYAYALDRALHTRGGTFPIIAIFPASVDSALVPAGVRTRLHISCRDPDWKERIKAAAGGRVPAIARQVVEPYFLQVHSRTNAGGFVLEARPRAGTWAPFIACVPADENAQVKLSVSHGPSGRVPGASVLVNVKEGTTNTPNGAWAFVCVGMEATPTMSYYIHCQAMPSKLVFGVEGGPPQFTIDPRTLP